MNCGAAGTRARGQIDLHFRFREGCTVYCHWADQADRARRYRVGCDLNIAKKKPPAVVASALRSSCGRQQTRGSGAHTRPRCTVAPGTSRPSIPSAVGVAGAFSCWPHTNTPLRSCRPSRPGGPSGGWSRGMSSEAQTDTASAAHRPVTRHRPCPHAGQAGDSLA